MEEFTGFIVWGHILLAICAVFYIAWWTMFFAPGIPKPQGCLYLVGAGCIVVAGILGLAGVITGSYGIAQLAPRAATAFPVWGVVLAGIALYVVLLLVTRNFFARPVTTELVLFCLWLTFELCALNVLSGAGVFSAPLACGLLAAVIVVFVVCLVCYVLYYNLPALPSFIDGAVPLVLVGIMSVIIAVLLK